MLIWPSMPPARGRHAYARVPSDGLVVVEMLVGVGIGDAFGEYSRVCAHSCEHVFRTGTECERYRVHMKSL